MSNTLNDKLISPGWPAVWFIYSLDNLWRSVLIPFVLTFLSLIVCFFSDKSPIVLLTYISDVIVSVCPSILGFTLSGYALMMGLSDSAFIKGLMRYKEEGKPHSMFQSLNSTFAIVLGVAFITTIVGVVAGIIIKADINLPNSLLCYSNIYNWLCLSFLFFLLFYTINSIKDIVVNIFNFGQYVQACSESENVE